MSTQQANESTAPIQATPSSRLPLSRPHLVTSGESRAAAEPLDLTEGLTLHGRAESHDHHDWPMSAAARRVATSSSLNTAAKRVFDIVGTLILAIVFSPLMLVIWLLMPRNGGSVIYKHRRIGKDGKAFECLKFRTMVPNAEEVLQQLLQSDPQAKAEWVSDHKLRNDPRITPVGRFLRRTSLDELPQLWNVIRGEMSLVGPRPVIKEELLRYGRNVGAYFAARPGITGLWQVTGRNDTDYRRRVALDTYYVRNQNLLLDLYILVKTTGVVLGGNGAY